jgi:hypothetical protein
MASGTTLPVLAMSMMSSGSFRATGCGDRIMSRHRCNIYSITLWKRQKKQANLLRLVWISVCGLGRNAPMLRHFFSRIIGLDLPEMGKRLEAEYPQVHGLYARVHTAPEAVKSEEFCALYDSVVLQHVTNRAYVNELLEIFAEKRAFRTFVSVYNNNSSSIDTDNPHPAYHRHSARY